MVFDVLFPYTIQDSILKILSPWKL